MPQFLVAIHHPDNYDASREDEAMHRDIDALNEEMDAADARFFAGGLQLASSAKSIRAQPSGKVLVTDGPYLETKEHIGGFWILECTDMNEALAGGARPPSPAARQSKCASFTESGPTRKSDTSQSTACMGTPRDRFLPNGLEE